MNPCPKKIRKIDDDLRKSYHERYCLICSKRGCDPCHIKTRGSGGDDEAWNIAPLCRRHHTEQGQIGIVTFAKKYPAFMNWLLANDWEILDQGRLIRP